MNRSLTTSPRKRFDPRESQSRQRQRGFPTRAALQRLQAQGYGRRRPLPLLDPCCRHQAHPAIPGIIFSDEIASQLQAHKFVVRNIVVESLDDPVTVYVCATERHVSAAFWIKAAHVIFG